MIPHRISVKFFVTEPDRVDLDAIIPVFHQWIQQSAVPGMLIDVADYRHMTNGPGVLLVGQDVDYAMDLGGGRPGLLYTSKRSSADRLGERLADAFNAGLLACTLLSADAALGGAIRFHTDQVELTLMDRLAAPNRAATFDEFRGEIETFVDALYEGTSWSIERDEEDERRCLTVRISAPGAPNVQTLMERARAGVSSAG